ncbi:MAG: nuclear transport factor 2 family protein [Candidatus Thiodiazotropha sp. (ex Monitilora ramsayi)]|nr:nuclear transport factor 2 family protein [Candidatus Thiodiazotropha sp. (ex Monitilora ramsayi)]
MSESPQQTRVFESPAVAEAHFYEAFANIDGQLMSEVWLDKEAVYCIHPSGQPLIGSQAVLDSWRAMFKGGHPLALFYRVVQKQVSDGMALHLVEETLSSQDGSRRGLVMASNCYLKTETGWRLFSHHGSPMVKPQTEKTGASAQVH